MHRGHHVDVPGQHCVAESGGIREVAEHHGSRVGSASPILLEALECDAVAFVPLGEREGSGTHGRVGEVGSVFLKDDPTALGEVVQQIVVALTQCQCDDVTLRGNFGDPCELSDLRWQHHGGIVIE